MREQRRSFSTWVLSNEELITTFSSGDDRQRCASGCLSQRVQWLDESCAAYIQEVLQPFKLAELLVIEEDRIGHLLIGIADHAFNFNAQKNVATIKGFVRVCNRFQKLARSHVRPVFPRLFCHCRSRFCGLVIFSR